METQKTAKFCRPSIVVEPGLRVCTIPYEPWNLQALQYFIISIYVSIYDIVQGLDGNES